MTLESLILCGDAEAVRVLRHTLEKLSIEVEICQEAKKASEILISEKFDAVIIDCDDVQGGFEVLRELRATPSNKNSVTFALLNGKKTSTQEAFGMGVNFVLQKPISPLNAARCFNAALGFMERERRRYYRQPVKMPVTVSITQGGEEFKAISTNVSEGGVAILLHDTLPKNATPWLKFTLPGTTAALQLETGVAWADSKGHVGLRFLNVPQSAAEVLEKWLNEQVEKQLPGSPESWTGSGSEVIQ
jgi:CheY-like chemotaxis protein